MNREQKRILKNKKSAKNLSNLILRVIDSLDLTGLYALRAHVDSRINLLEADDE